MATRASAKRKRGSAPVTPAGSPAARRARGGGAAAAAAAPAEPPTLVECEGSWATSLRVARGDGHFLDAVLTVSGGKEARAHTHPASVRTATAGIKHMLYGNLYCTENGPFRSRKVASPASAAHIIVQICGT